MLLTKKQITAKNIVKNVRSAGQRLTTYDATVGEIIDRGAVFPGNSFKLAPRGIVWVVSQEEFHLTLDVTGLATLKTSWTHGGVLALNVGVIDPGWHGPVATAVVNFGVSDFYITKGQPFFRVLFHEHDGSDGDIVKRDRPAYIKEIREKSEKFSTTFLSMDSLITEVSNEVLKFPRWALVTGVVGLVVTVAAMVIAIAAIFVPISVDVWRGGARNEPRIAALEAQVKELTEKSASKNAEPPTNK